MNPFVNLILVDAASSSNKYATHYLFIYLIFSCALNTFLLKGQRKSDKDVNTHLMSFAYLNYIFINLYLLCYIRMQ